MPTSSDIQSAKESLYETSALRDDLNDAEATVLLQWAETQIDRIAQKSVDADFSQQIRFFKQLVKGINRFVGQREFNDQTGMQPYMDKITMWTDKVIGFSHVTEEALWASLPEDKKDMAGTLQAMLGVLTSSDPALTTEAPQAVTEASIETPPASNSSAETAPDASTEETSDSPEPPAPMNPIESLAASLFQGFRNATQSNQPANLDDTIEEDTSDYDEEDDKEY